MTGRFLAIGECMVELMQVAGGLMRKGFAGDTFNAAYYARAVLPPDWSVDYFTAVGADPISAEMLAFMERAGVGTGRIRQVPERSPGLYMIHLDEGERSFSYWRSASAARLLAGDRAALREAMAASDIILYSGITLAILEGAGAATLIEEAAAARDAGKIVAFDPNIRPRLWPDPDAMRAVLSEGARAANVLLPSFDDEAAHFGDEDVAATVARYRALGVARIAVKLGAQGAFLSFDGHEGSVPAANVERVVDTTSAGDAFNGAFLSHLARHGDPQAAAAFAASVAAVVISHYGALVERDLLPAGIV